MYSYIYLNLHKTLAFNPPPTCSSVDAPSLHQLMPALNWENANPLQENEER